uniref:deaminase domain-containing protein n=1 Tax=Serratia microhaemolytica TaxID=2675110 RepID=UPI001F0C1EE1
DACSNGGAASAACAQARLEVIAAKEGYENLGNYNSKASQQYADAYGQIVDLLNITSVDAQNQQQVKDAMVNYAMDHFGLDKATAEQYVSTYDGMKTVAASLSPVLGYAAASKISQLGQKVVLQQSGESGNVGWKSYLESEKAIQQSVAMKQQITDLRSGLSSKIKNSGNAAVAQIDIEGMPKTMAAHSRISEENKGFIGDGGQNFTYQTLKASDGRLVERNTDSEYKILDNLADLLGSNTSAKGNITILTERPACASCLGVVDQFQQKYPNIQVNVLDNNGVLLTPRKK